jgi:hypothetical protein
MEALRVPEDAAFLVDLDGFVHKGSGQWCIEVVFEAVGQGYQLVIGAAAGPEGVVDVKHFLAGDAGQFGSAAQILGQLPLACSLGRVGLAVQCLTVDAKVLGGHFIGTKGLDVELI